METTPPVYHPQTKLTPIHSIKLACCGFCSNLQLQAEQHSEEDKKETKEANGQADQPSEQSPLPGRVVELLTARNRTAALHALWRGGGGDSQEGHIKCLRSSWKLSEMFVLNVILNAVNYFIVFIHTTFFFAKE